MTPERRAGWEAPNFAEIFEDQVVGRQFVRFGDERFLHHLVLRNGDILDFLVQAARRVAAKPRPQASAPGAADRRLTARMLLRERTQLEQEVSLRLLERAHR